MRVLDRVQAACMGWPEGKYMAFVVYGGSERWI